jgi:nucleoside-diphosphate-sugar epimerase
MKYYVLGGGGLLGGAIIRALLKEKRNVINIDKSNYKKFINTKCDIFIYTNGNSNKYFATQNPFLDFEMSVTTVMKSINDFKFKKFIFFSSCDIYDKISIKNTSEDVLIKKSNNYYGKNKYIAETIVKLYCRKWLIIRLGPLIGKNLKKNAIFNLLKNKKVYTNILSKSSYILTDTVAKFLLKLLHKKKNNIFNISGKQPISFRTIKQLMKSKSIFERNRKINNYNVSTKKIEKCLNVKIPKTINEINKFINKSNI